jgi:hypothetical protein
MRKESESFELNAGGKDEESGVEAGLSYGSSEVAENGFNSASSGFTESVTETKIGIIYKAKIDGKYVTDEFNEDFKNISNERDAFIFMRNYGTHFITEAHMGAKSQFTM